MTEREPLFIAPLGTASGYVESTGFLEEPEYELFLTLVPIQATGVVTELDQEPVPPGTRLFAVKDGDGEWVRVENDGSVPA